MTRRTPPAAVPAAAPAPSGPSAAEPAPEPALRTAARSREPSATRFTARDYTYVRRELQRIMVLATAIVILIVVLSFFLP